MADIAGVLDLLDLADVRSRDVLSAEQHSEIAAVVERVHARHGFLGEVLVVAVAGGTGSGKSSIVNALVGRDLVATGVVRPTTQMASAIHPEAPVSDLGPVLDALGVDDRIASERLEDIVLVDLPDFDSFEEAHRHVVEDVIPRVDAVIWVMDPEKYADPVAHQEFLSRLTEYEPQFVFVLNQADRLLEMGEKVVESLRNLLVRDGFSDPMVVATSASPRDGSAPDISELVDAIDGHLDVKTTALSKIAADLRSTANVGWNACVASGLEATTEGERAQAALAAATFVTLGVAAYELYARTAPERSIVA